MKSVKVESDLEHQSIEKDYGHTQSEWANLSQTTKKIPLSFISIK